MRPGYPSINPSHRSTVGFAQPTGFAGMKQCFMKPLLRPLIRGGAVEQPLVRSAPTVGLGGLATVPAP